MARTQQQARWLVMEETEGEDEFVIFASFTRLEMLYIYSVEFSTSKSSFLLIKISANDSD